MTNHLRPAGYFELTGPDDALAVGRDHSYFCSHSSIDQPYYFHNSNSKHGQIFKSEEANRMERVKTLEQLVYDLVQSSAEAAAAAAEDPEDLSASAVALAKARESLAALESLKSALTHEQRSPGLGHNIDDDDDQAKETPPMTTGVNVFDLTIMAKSNLASQLRNNNYLKEALELYTQLCKLAGSSTGSSGSLIMSMGGTGNGQQTAIASSSQQHGARFCLHRFGLNVGNIYFEMQEYQRALKYYRLTLDRLASAPGNQQLKIKLMNNISLALIALGQANNPTNDSINSLNHLLIDNLPSSTKVHQQAAKLATPNQAKDSESQAINSNHHRFVFNLVVCLYLRSELGRMITVLRDNVSVNIGGAFKRVSRENTSDESHQHLEQNVGFKGRIDSGSTTSSTATIVEQQQQLAARENPSKPSASAPTGHDSDELELLIKEREAQMYRCLKLSCKLILDLANQNTNEQQTALDQCLQILSSSDTTRVLTLDLKTDCVLQLLSKRNGLDEAIRLFEESANQEREDRTTWPPGRKQRTKSAQSATTTTRQQTSSNEAKLNSSVVLNNLSLLYSLRGELSRALEVSQRALAMNKSDVIGWINLGNCHQNQDNLEQAESCYDQAMQMAPNSGIAKYNLVQLERKLGRNYDDLSAPVREKLADERRAVSKLLYKNMILLPIQIGQLYQRSGMHKQALTIFNELIDRRKQCPPELHLLLSRTMLANQRADGGEVPAPLDEDNFSGGQARPKWIQLVQEANRNHAYHLPLAEHLIALHIESFDYRAAGEVLLECIKNRPDQVKWYQMLAECHRRSADYKQAMSVYKLASDLFPLDTSCLKALVKLTDELGLDEENRICQAKLARVVQNKRNLTTSSE